jgi:hypothetical protein
VNNVEFAKNVKNIATNYKTLYVMGCFGAPMNSINKSRYCKNHSYNKQASRTKMINSASTNTFGFDCVGLIKGVLWGWAGNTGKNYGGATYASNNVPDTNADTMISKCSDVTTNFSNIQVGEVVWMKGHIGVYIGDGLAVECTPSWRNGVQITACNRSIGGYNRRNWTKHGKLPYIKYDASSTSVKTVNDDLNLPTIKQGSKGNTVKSLQILLIGYGYSCGKCGADGDFGSGTFAAAKNYQKAKGLTADGIVGPTTWKKLLGVN